MHRILIVEDNPLNSELLQDWLETEGYAVATATTINEAKAELDGLMPDAVLLDVQLGLEDGLTLAVAIRNDPRLSNLPIIAVTAHAMITDQQRVMEAGCDASVSKPIDFDLLREKLQAFISDPTYRM
ncbi:MAG TPA: response regulator [Terracidiphilus sp.]|jgi:CheY-like chemotaxis protein|nr:response regulator [Terracidiphilus sp.]